MEKPQDLRAWGWGLGNLPLCPFFSPDFLCFVLGGYLILSWWGQSYDRPFHRRGEPPPLKACTWVFRHLNVNFPKGFGPWLGGASILWTSQCYRGWRLLRQAISRPFVHLDGPGGCGCPESSASREGSEEHTGKIRNSNHHSFLLHIFIQPFS